MDESRPIAPGEEMPEPPERIPVIPVQGIVLFPFMVLPLFARGERNESAVDSALAGSRLVFITGVEKEEISGDPAPGDVYEVGTVATILRMLRVPDGGYRLMIQGLYRAKAEGIAVEGNLMTAKAARLEEEADSSPRIEALMRNVNDQLEKAASMGKTFPPDFILIAHNIEDPGKLADMAASTLNISAQDGQGLLEELDHGKRLSFVSKLLSKEIEILSIQDRIRSEVKQEVEKGQKKYFLREQLTAIQRELGEEDPRAEEFRELMRRIGEARMLEAAEKQTVRELERLERSHPDSAEANVIRTYIEWMLDLPWSISTTDNLNLKNARKVLDEDHYGLDRVKERIIEFLGVRKLKADTRGPILCFVGPPGVGKTSLGRSIARAMDRKFMRMSLGGMRDEAEIRGHRRTYVGALPGRIINGLKQAASNNPVFMLDEVDKIGADFRGDPSSALLEVLDPEQNNSFSDHYIDVPFDLSKVLFIATANVLHTIPPALQDRMETIQLPGYTEEEKLQIARKFLLPKQIAENGLKPENISVDDEAIKHIIRNYTREAGLRNLERELSKVCRKVATSIAEGKRRKRYKIGAKQLRRYLGPPRADLSLVQRKDRVGVVNGLAWTQSGGEVLTIEAIMMEGRGGVALTGMLGDVMKESAQAAVSYARSNAKKLKLSTVPNEKHDLHIHVPAGAIPKDGPSAGVALATAIVSVLKDVPARCDVAMTGEISLTGNVLPIGGLKQKVLAAKREGIHRVIVPARNRNDVEEMTVEEKAGMRFIYVNSIGQALKHALRERKGKAEKKKAGKKGKK
ncbi:MAG: endopeptidase La [bacterium]